MSIEIPNTLNAAGVFANPNSFPLYDSPIMNAQGVEPYDPAQSPSNIVGGLTRGSAGLYIVRQVEAIDFLEGVAVAQAAYSSTTVAQATILPGAPTNPTVGIADKKAVGVHLVNTAADGASVDGPFQLLVWRFSTGPQFSDLPTS